MKDNSHTRKKKYVLKANKILRLKKMSGIFLLIIYWLESLIFNNHTCLKKL